MATSTSTAPTAPEALASERLTLRPLLPADAGDLHRLINDWEVAKNLARVPFPYPRDLADQWIAQSRAAMAEGSAYRFVIEGESGGRRGLLGGIGLNLGEDRRSAELGYWLARSAWGQGFAREACARLIAWGFAQLDIAEITAEALLDNARSRAVLARLGFREAGEAERDFVSRGGPMVVMRYAITRLDLAAPAPPPPEAAAQPAIRPLLLVAACALIDPEGRVLLARRPEGKALAGLWEFPGGKLAPGETPEAGLIRELREELAIDVSEACLAPFAFASHAYGRFHLLMPLYVCRRWEGRVTPQEGQAVAWVRAQRLGDYPMPPADKPLVALLRDLL
jgi:8-oxo-dGTP diphosphatase